MCRTRCLQSTYSPPVGSIYAPKGLQIQISSGFYSEYFAKFLRKKINENLKHMKHESWFRTYRVNKMTHKIFSNLRKHSEVSQCIVLTHSYNTTETNGGHVLGRQKQRQTCHNLDDFCVSQMIWTACILTCTLVRGQHRLLLFCCWIWIPLCETPGWLCKLENIFKTFIGGEFKCLDVLALLITLRKD